MANTKEYSSEKIRGEVNLEFQFSLSCHSRPTSPENILVVSTVGINWTTKNTGSYNLTALLKLSSRSSLFPQELQNRDFLTK